MDCKPFTTYSQQIELIRSRGCEIPDTAFCEEVLRNTGYYHLSAYFLPFRRTDDTYLPGTTFERIYAIYQFDAEMRSILFSIIETIEIALRSELSYFHGSRYGELGYMEGTNYSAKHDHQKFLDLFQHEIDANRNAPFVKHHLKNYNGNFPVWAALELFTFGMLSRFYTDMTTQDRKAFASSFSRGGSKAYKDLASHLRCCTDLRNICAHYGRLYYRIFPAIPAGIVLTEYEKRRLWGALLAVREVYPSASRWNSEIVRQLTSLADRYRMSIDLSHIAFPNDWQKKLVI